MAKRVLSSSITKPTLFLATNSELVGHAAASRAMIDILKTK
jgi:hypothetical protein